MMMRVQELCRKLRPVLGERVDRLWAAYLAESDASGKAELEQTLELLAAKHLGQDYMPDRSPFPPPDRAFALSGDVSLGTVTYASRTLYSFFLKGDRLKEHILVAGRSGSGKTNLAFVLMKGIMARGVKVLAIDWKRGYRDLLQVADDLDVYTVGREVSPLRFNPLIPPPGCEPHVWIKLVVDVIASAYLGGEGVISLLVAGLDRLYDEAGVYAGHVTRYPTIEDLLQWLRTAKLKGRAAMWQASAERILLAMTYGEFGSVVNTQDNTHVGGLLDRNVILEMDALSSNSDRKLFSEALTLYLYRYRLALGPQPELTNLIVLEEAHNLLLQKPAESRESVLETSIRMIRQYGMGYVFVDQSASLLSKVAFANSYATVALSQKLRGDVQAMASAMNLSDEQKQALSTLPVGTAIVRLADEHPEPFLIRVPRFPIREGAVSDEVIRRRMGGHSRDSSRSNRAAGSPGPVSPVPAPDKKRIEIENSSHPPSPGTPEATGPSVTGRTPPPTESGSRNSEPSRETVRFLADVSARPLSTTVARYQRLKLSRRKGNAIRQELEKAGVIAPIRIGTRSGQVVLYDLTESGRTFCTSLGVEPGPRARASLEHRYWVQKATEHFQNARYDTAHDHVIEGNGIVDLVASRPGERVAVEVETGKSDTVGNVVKTRAAGFDRVILLATSPQGAEVCRRAIDMAGHGDGPPVELLTWLDIS